MKEKQLLICDLYQWLFTSLQGSSFIWADIGTLEGCLILAHWASESKTFCQAILAQSFKNKLWLTLLTISTNSSFDIPSCKSCLSIMTFAFLSTTNGTLFILRRPLPRSSLSLSCWNDEFLSFSMDILRRSPDSSCSSSFTLLEALTKVSWSTWNKIWMLANKLSFKNRINQNNFV